MPLVILANLERGLSTAKDAIGIASKRDCRIGGRFNGPFGVSDSATRVVPSTAGDSTARSVRGLCATRTRKPTLANSNGDASILLPGFEVAKDQLTCREQQAYNADETVPPLRVQLPRH